MVNSCAVLTPSHSDNWPNFTVCTTLVREKFDLRSKPLKRPCQPKTSAPAERGDRGMRGRREEAEGLMKEIIIIGKNNEGKKAQNANKYNNPKLHENAQGVTLFHYLTLNKY